MESKVNTVESNEVLGILTRALVEAAGINKSSDPEARTAIAQFLKKIEDEAVSFFRKNIDRRAKEREKPIISDMAAYYRVSSSFY